MGLGRRLSVLLGLYTIKELQFALTHLPPLSLSLQRWYNSITGPRQTAESSLRLYIMNFDGIFKGEPPGFPLQTDMSGTSDRNYDG